MIWLQTTLVVLLVFAACISAAVLYGARRWKAGTKELRARLAAARTPVEPSAYDAREIESLPAPVQRYFRAVLKDGQPLVAAARFSHEGQFNMSASGQSWTPFASNQFVVTRRPGFDWDARIRMAPGLKVFVHDAYVAGDGILLAKLFGLLTVADIHGTREAAEGELTRFVAEAAWYPTALLPSQGVRWQAIDERSARATLQDGPTSVSLEFRLDPEGLISTVRAAARPRSVNGKLVPTPWQGRFWGYELRHGVRIPLQGEVAWELADGLRPYWRGRITDIAYDLAR
jgi:hypothetical protein